MRSKADIPDNLKFCMVEWYNQKIQCSHTVTLWHFVTSATAEIVRENSTAASWMSVVAMVG